MDHILDEIDRRILRALQKDAAQSLDAVAEHVHLSRNACWRRIKRMEDAGITGTVSFPFAFTIGPDSTLDQKRADLEGFADNVIKHAS